MKRSASVALLVAVVVAHGHDALAQKDAGSGAEPPAVGPDKPEKPDKSDKSDRSGAGAPDLEGDDEHGGEKVPKEKGVAPKREATLTKDGMNRIPGGRFTMGSSDKKAQPNEKPPRVVVVPPFWIDKTEVSVGAYKACVDRGACTRPPKTSAQCTYDMGDAQLPVSCVPWSLANTYCLAIGKRLPREVEWEMAARGTTPVSYPWGGGAGCGVAATLAADNTQRSCSGKKPSKVGAHLGGASPYGVLDMSGNVEEWVADWYAETVSDLSPRAGASHVLRGGGWLSPPSLARATTRNWGSVREAGPNVGFRCARDD